MHPAAIVQEAMPRISFATLLVLLLGCARPSAPTVATIPADERAAKARGGSVAAAPEELDDTVEDGGSLPSGDDAIGKKAPGFALESPVEPSQKVRLRRNKVTVLHFWATWCGPCQKSLPRLQKLSQQHADRGLAVIGLSVDDEPNEIAAFVRATGARFAIGFDAGHQVTERYKPTSMPTTFVIDRAGVVRAVQPGYRDGDDHELEELVKSLL
jgi:peroxiredoxin